MHSISSLSLYWHTLRHMKPVQFTARLGRKVFKPKPDLHPAPKLRTKTGPWQSPPAPSPSMTGAHDFRFLNQAGSVRHDEDWNAPGKDKLWLYNLHYFDDLRAENESERADWHRNLIALWIVQNPPGSGNGWEPYPLSLRIVNWIKWAIAGNTLQPEWTQSLAVQVRFLRRSLEWHLLGNHLLANAKALFFAGLFFEGREADEWRQKGLKIYRDQLREQILPDGGHFELSPMYHSIILEDLLDVLNISAAYPNLISNKEIERWKLTVNRMRRCLKVMTHPDGEISFFNDAAFGISIPPTALENYAVDLKLGVSEQPVEGITYLENSGYIRVQYGETVALLDVAQIGPDYLPGHAHADTLSFELSVHGERVIVNSGTSVYGSGAERLRQRTTAAHSTVEIDGQNSSEVWSGFRVARRARPFNLEISDEADGFTIHCSHDGYKRLRGKNICTRMWQFTKERLCVIDQVSGPHNQAIARFYFHPGIEAECSEHEIRLSTPKGAQLKYVFNDTDVQLKPSNFYPMFGVSKINKYLELTSNTGYMKGAFLWEVSGNVKINTNLV